MQSRGYTNASANLAFPDELLAQLKALPHWMGTRTEPRPGKPGKLDKPPYRVRPGLSVIKADKTNPENWSSFEEAYCALAAGAVDAIGFVFTDKDPFCGVDLDSAINPETGEIEEWASEATAGLPTYWEVSISGTGLRSIARGKKPGPRCRSGNVEIYDGSTGARFMVITGNVLALGGGAPIRECQPAIDALYERTFGPPKTGAPPPPTPLHSLEDEELLRRARNAKNGPEFIALYDHGDTSGYKSPSDADFALLGKLAFWCVGDRARMIELFEASALYRPPPAKAAGYVALSVDKMLSEYDGDYYRPKAIREIPPETQEDTLSPYLALLLDASAWRGQKAGSSYKAYAALVALTIERGIKADNGTLQIGVDMRTLAGRAGLPTRTLTRSALPHLIKEGRIYWRRGRGGGAGVFVLKRPPSGDHSKVLTEREGVSSLLWSPRGAAIDILKTLIRMRGGCPKPSSKAKLGEVMPARLGIVAMFCTVALVYASCEQTFADLVVLTGRRKDHVKSAMRKLADARIVQFVGAETVRLTPNFLAEYVRSLEETGIARSEYRDMRRSTKERAKDAEKLRKKRTRKKVVNIEDARPTPPPPPRPEPPPNNVTPIIRRYREDRERTRKRPNESRDMQRRYDRLCEEAQRRLMEDST